MKINDRTNHNKTQKFSITSFVGKKNTKTKKPQINIIYSIASFLFVFPHPIIDYPILRYFVN